VSKYRPRVPVFAFSPLHEVLRRTALYWGVQGMLVGRLASTDAMLHEVRRICLERRLCRTGVPVVIVAGVPLNVPGNTNLMSIHRV